MSRDEYPEREKGMWLINCVEEGIWLLLWMSFFVWCMQLSYFHVAADVPSGDPPESAVVIDVLRATTTIACALDHGAEAVQTFADLDDLKICASKWPVSSRLLLGERGGRMLEGFDLGNSPVAVDAEKVCGKRLFMSTTNGTRSLHRVSTASNLYTASLLNRRAVAEAIIKGKPRDLWIVGSGWEGDYSLEDSFAAGALTAYLLENSKEMVHLMNDELISALAVWEQWKTNPEACLRTASHGKRLVKLGDHDADFSCCAQLDKLAVVPKQVEPGVLMAS